MTNYLVSENVNAAIGLLAIVRSCTILLEEFFLITFNKKKCIRISPRYLSECIKKEDGSNYSKNLDNLDWAERSPGLAEHKIALKDKKT